MSWQAMGAVQEGSGFVQRGEFVGFRVLMAIAWYADEKGVAGRKGQRKACPTQRALAARARVHVNTVASWLPRLVQAGELALERYGSGRGTHTVYRILLPVERSGDGQRVVASGVERSPDEGEKAGEVMRRLEALEQRMGELVRDLEDSGQGTAKVRSAERPHESPHGGSERPHENRERPRERPHGGSERAQERPHGGGERSHEGGERPHENRERPQEGGKKATGVQRGDVEDPLDPFFDPVIDPEGDPGGSRATGKHKDGKGHTAPPSPAIFQKEQKVAFGKRVQALAKVCGLDLRIGAHRRQCEQAARQLAPYDAALILQRFGPLARGKRQATCRGTWQWYVDDWRGARKGEQPRPNDVVANISRERVQVGPEEAKSVFSDAASGSAAEAGLGPAQIAFREFMRQEARRGGR